MSKEKRVQQKQSTVPAQGATSGWVMPALVFKWFPLCEFSLSDTP